MKRLRPPLLLFLLAIISGTCLAEPSRDQTAEGATPETVASAIRVEHGRPNRLLDDVGWVLGTPYKLALWDRRAENHRISQETEGQLIEYLEENQLDSVLVRVNQYDPWGEWKRLTQNKRVGAGWRYTVGTLNWVKYTLLPGRLLGGDWYNPYTDTVNLYSDIPAIAISDGAYAKDVHERDKPGTYAAVQEIPIVGMWHETLANRKAIEHVKSHGNQGQQEEAYRILYPDYGGSWGGQLVSFLPYGSVYGRLVGAAAGHVANGFRTLTSRQKSPVHLSAKTSQESPRNKRKWRFQ